MNPLKLPYLAEPGFLSFSAPFATASHGGTRAQKVNEAVARQGTRTTNRMGFFLPCLSGGGAERVVVTLAGVLAREGLPVDLVLGRVEGPYLSEVSPRVRIVGLQARRGLSSILPLARYLREERPRVLLSTLDYANVIALWAKTLARVPTRTVVRVASTFSQEIQRHSPGVAQLYRWVVARSYRRADAVVAVSRGVAEDLIRETDLPKEKLRVIYNPVDIALLHEQAKEPLDHPWFTGDHPPVIIGVGRLTEQKNFALLIRAFAKVRRQRDARLLILGEGEQRHQLEALVRSLGLDQHVALPGFVNNPFNYMRRARVLALSSRWEGLPNVILQALALGVPVVATDCPGGPAEILTDPSWGLLVPAEDEDALAQGINAALDGRVPVPPESLVEEKYGLAAQVKAYKDVLQI